MADEVHPKTTNHETKNNETDLEKKDKRNILGNIVTTLLGILSTLLTAFFVTVSAASVQLLEKSVPDLQLNSVRSLVPLVLTVLVFIAKKELPHIPQQGFIHILGYSLVSSIYGMTLYVSVIYLPLGTVQSLVMTSNLMSGIVLFRIFLEEKISGNTILSVILSTLGILLVLQPEFIFKFLTSNTDLIPEESHNFQNQTGTNMADHQESNLMKILIFGGLFAVVTGVGFSFQGLFLKFANEYMDIVENTWNISFWAFFTQTYLSILLMYFLESFRWPETLLKNIYILLHAVAYFLMRTFHIFALSKLQGHTTVLILTAFTVLFMVLAQYTILSDIQPGHRNWMEIVGIILVLIGSTLQSFVELCKKNK